MTRKYKSGDWVRIQGCLQSPKMQVLKYITNKNSLFGFDINDTYLECVWYENGERKSEIFHQDRLIKSIETGGLFKV